MSRVKIDEAILKQKLQALEPVAATLALDPSAIEAKLQRRSVRRRHVRGGLIAVVCLIVVVGLAYRKRQPDRPIASASRQPLGETVAKVIDAEIVENSTADLEAQLQLLSLKAEVRRLELEQVKLADELLLTVRHRAELRYYQRVLP